MQSIHRIISSWIRLIAMPPTLSRTFSHCHPTFLICCSGFWNMGLRKKRLRSSTARHACIFFCRTNRFHVAKLFQLLYCGQEKESSETGVIFVNHKIRSGST